MGVPVYIHQERRGHEMRRLLRLLIQHEAVGVPDQWPVVCVEEHLIWKLCGEKQQTLKDLPSQTHS